MRYLPSNRDMHLKRARMKTVRTDEHVAMDEVRHYQRERTSDSSRARDSDVEPFARARIYYVHTARDGTPVGRLGRLADRDSRGTGNRLRCRFSVALGRGKKRL